MADMMARALATDASGFGEPPRTVGIREIAVIVPAYNAASTIDAQLDALAAQDYTGAWSIVVALQPCTDDTEAVIRRRNDPRVTIVDASRRMGASAARNDGVASTTASHVAFCDADDIVAPHWLSSLASDPCAEVVVGARVPFVGEFDPVAIDMSKKYSAKPNSGFLMSVFSNTCMVKRDVLLEVGGFDEEFAGIEDIELGFRLQLSGHEVRCAPDADVYYRARSTTWGTWRQRRQWEVGRVALYRRYASDGMPRSDTREALRDWVWLIARLPGLRDPRIKKRWLRRSAVRSGRFVGSLRYRRLYL